jgi:hypothetical protein
MYEMDAGVVVRIANSQNVAGEPNANIIFEILTPVTEATFLGDYPEAIEVTSMADITLSNPNVITEPTPNATAFTVSVTTITTAGTPQQLPSIVVPDGRALVVASDAANDPKKHVFVATSSANALAPATRVTLSPGNSVTLYVDNADKVWVDTDLNGQKVDVIVEQ